MRRLENKVIVLFGGNGRLGQSFNKVLLESGAILYSCDIKVFDEEYKRGLMKEYPDKVFFKDFNATNKNELIRIRKEILEKHLQIDILINSTTSKGDDFYLPFEDVSLEGWNIGLLGNLTLPFLTSQVFLEPMRKNRSGSVINISSIYGIVGNDQALYKGSNLSNVYVDSNTDLKNDQIYSHAVYNAAKAGLNSLTRYLAAYYGKYNVRVNTITPGGISHPDENEEFVKKYSNKTPLGRKADIDDINGALVYLASDESSYVTGHNLVVDGGFTIW